MLKCSHRTLIFLAGIAWLGIGIFLLSLGISFILQTVDAPSFVPPKNQLSFVNLLSKYFANPQNVASILLATSLFIGYLKGRYVLSKSAFKQIARIKSLPNPASLKYLYSKGYYLLILSMISLGILLRFLPITIDVRGFVDVAIGSALINSAMIYFRGSLILEKIKQ